MPCKLWSKYWPNVKVSKQLWWKSWPKVKVCRLSGSMNSCDALQTLVEVLAKCQGQQATLVEVLAEGQGLQVERQHEFLQAVGQTRKQHNSPATPHAFGQTARGHCQTCERHNSRGNGSVTSCKLWFELASITPRPQHLTRLNKLPEVIVKLASAQRHNVIVRAPLPPPATSPFSERGGLYTLVRASPAG